MHPSNSICEWSKFSFGETTIASLSSNMDSGIDSAAPGPGILTKLAASTASVVAAKAEPEQDQLLGLVHRTDQQTATKLLTGLGIFNCTLRPSAQQVCSAEVLQTCEQQSTTTPVVESSLSNSCKRRLIIPDTSSDMSEEQASVTPGSSATQTPSETPTLVREQGRFTFSIVARVSDETSVPLSLSTPSPSATPTLVREQVESDFFRDSVRPDQTLQEPPSPTATQEYEDWLSENISMAEQDTSLVRAKRSRIKAERYGSAFQLYPKEKIVEHLSRLERGVSYLTTQASLDRFGRDWVGCPDGTLFVSPVDDTIAVLERSGGEVSKIKELLGVPHWPEDAVIRAISIKEPKKFYMSLPCGQEFTANDEFEYGGFTKNGIREIILQKKVPQSAFTEESPAQFLVRLAPGKALHSTKLTE